MLQHFQTWHNWKCAIQIKMTVVSGSHDSYVLWLNHGELRHIYSCCSVSVLSQNFQVKMLLSRGLYCMDLQYTSGEIFFFLKNAFLVAPWKFGGELLSASLFRPLKCLEPFFF